MTSMRDLTETVHARLLRAVNGDRIRDIGQQRAP